MGIAPSNMGIVTEWQDPTLDDIHYEYIADQIFNFQIYLKNAIIATYSIRWQYNDNQRSEDAIIYDQSGEPMRLSVDVKGYCNSFGSKYSTKPISPMGVENPLTIG